MTVMTDPAGPLLGLLSPNFCPECGQLVTPQGTQLADAIAASFASSMRMLMGPHPSQIPEQRSAQAHGRRHRREHHHGPGRRDCGCEERGHDDCADCGGHGHGHGRPEHGWKEHGWKEHGWKEHGCHGHDCHGQDCARPRLRTATTGTATTGTATTGTATTGSDTTARRAGADAIAGHAMTSAGPAGTIHANAGAAFRGVICSSTAGSARPA